jgi:hypothetical protein
VLKKLALVAALALGSATAHAESITIGYWDQANGLNSPIIPIITMPSFDLFTLNGQSFGTMHGVLSGLRTVGGNYEVAINNIFSTGPGTVRIYATFSGVLAPPGGARFHFPSLFQRTEDPLPGWTVAEQIFVCVNGNLFCDNYLNPTGIMVDNHHFTNGASGNVFTDSVLNFLPGQPFSITEVFHLVSPAAEAHIAGAIWTQPFSTPAPVPGPIVGAGLPGLLLGLGWLAWRRYGPVRRLAAD